MLKQLCLFIFICSVSIYTNAQKHQFQNFSVNNGLAQNSVNYVIVDQFGIAWIATADGLNCYNGHNMKLFKNNSKDSFSIHNNYIYQLLLCKNQDIIIYGKNGFEYFNRKQNKFIELLNLNDLKRDSVQGFLMGISDSSLFIQRKSNEILQMNIYTKKKQIIYLKGQNFSLNPDNNNSTKNVIYNDNKLIFGNQSVLYSYDIKLQKISILYRKSKINEPFSHTVKDLSIFVLEGNRLINLDFNGKIKNIDTLPRFINPNSIGYLKIDKYKNIWVSLIGKGLIKLEFQFNQKSYLYRNVEELPSKYITFISNDALGNMWFGTDGQGAYFLNHRSQLIKQFTVPNKSLMIKSIVPFDQHRFFIGTIGEGLYILDLKNNTLSSFKDCKIQEVYTICKVDPQTFYLGNTEGLFVFHLNIGKINKINLFDSIKNIFIQNITCYHGNLLLSTKIGLFEYDISKGRIVKNFTKSYGSISINSVYCDVDETLWILSEYCGIWRYRNNQLVQFKIPEFGDNYFLVGQLYKQGNLNYWFATENGLLNIRFHDESKQKFKVIIVNSQQNLPNDCIYSIQPGSNNSLWVSTNKGIAKFNPENGKIVNFDLNDGLQSNEFNTGAYWKNNLGDFIYGGVKGLNFFNEKTLDFFINKPQTFITNFKSNEITYHQFNLPQSIHLNYTDKEFEFSFHTNDYSSSNQTFYYYKINGYHSKWVETKTLSNVHFTGFESGTYEFLFKVKNADGVYSDEQKIILIIDLPLWKKWWFISCMIIISIVIIIFIILKYVALKYKQKLEHLQRQQEIERIRYRISSDLHDDIGSGLSKIALMSELAKTNIDNPDKLQSKLISMAENSREMIRNLGEIVWAINPQNDNMHNFMAYIRNYIYEYLENAEINVSLDWEQSIENISISPELKRNLFLIIKETLHNIVKHANAKDVFVSFKIKKSEYYIIIKDNGIGSKLDINHSKGNGIQNMKKRAEIIHAEISFSQIPNSGVEIIIKGNLY